MTAALTEREIVESVDVVEDDPDTTHLVCHCTDFNVAACGLDVAHLPWTPDAPEERDCPLCVLAWPDGWTCPSGCACEDCWPEGEAAAS